MGIHIRRRMLSLFFFFSSRRRHTRSYGDWSSDVCSSDLFLILTTVVARGVEDVDAFIEHLEKTGAFSNAQSVEEHVNEQGQLEAHLEMKYGPGPVKRSGGGNGQQ